MTDATWIFGYGSLVWRADFPYVQRELAWIEGYTRRFWQGSTDHRGVPEAPGRVVTLIEEADARCLGVAYRLATAEREEVLRHLDYRERGGYDRLILPLVFPGAQHAHTDTRAIVYLANESNPNYLGPAPYEAIANQILGAHGPSGPNPEYLFELAGFLRRHGAPEPHVFALEALLQARGKGEG